MHAVPRRLVFVSAFLRFCAALYRSTILFVAAPWRALARNHHLELFVPPCLYTFRMLRATRPNVSRVRQRSRWGHASRVSNLQGRSVAQEGAENGAEPKMARRVCSAPTGGGAARRTMAGFLRCRVNTSVLSVRP